MKDKIGNTNKDEWDSLRMLKPETLEQQVGGSHYQDMAIQPWEIMRANNTAEEYTAYHINTVIAYLLRHKQKGGLWDIKKAHHHLSELINYLEIRKNGK